MPVVVPCAAVDRDGERGALRSRCCAATISGRSSSSSRSPVIGTQITPDVWRTMNAIFSGVVVSAAMMRSPSFSRSSSSTTTTISPRPMAATASLDLGRTASSCSLLGRASGRAAARRTWRSRRPRGSRGRPGPCAPSVVTAAVCGMTATVKPSSSDVDDREADAVDGDRALLDDVAQQLGAACGPAGRAPGSTISPTRVDVALHEVAAEPVGRAAPAARG